ncbi:MAG: amidohydrolase family protein [Pseudomonadota bacterium]
MTIIDAHHHIWRRADLPWLLGPTQPRIFGAYDGIKRDYLIGEYLADVAQTGVTKSVYVQANWPPNWARDEVAFVEKAHAATGWPHAISAFCDMTQKDARHDLDRLTASPLVRGVRHQMHHHPNPLYRFAKDAGTVATDAVIANVQRLADYKLLFELQIFAGQVPAARRLIEACPKVNFVLQHAGMPEELTHEGKAAWREAMTQLASHSNVYCKLSGFGTFIHKVDQEHISFAIQESVALFGPSRCLYGSNFPIEKLWTDYGTLFTAMKTGVEAAAPGEEAVIFNDVAARLYRL